MVADGRPASSDSGVQTSARTVERVSTSVEGASRRLSGQETVTSWEIVYSLLQAHSDYAPAQRRLLLLRPGLTGGERRPIEAWLRLVRSLFIKSKVPVLHGKPLIVGLSMVDPQLKQYLANDGFLDALRASIVNPPFDELLRISDPTPMHLDSPSTQDDLGRRGFATSIAGRLGRIWGEYSRSDARGSFMLHLDGRWGSGKSTLLNLLRQELEPAQAQGSEVDLGWIVVDFNAWQHQRLDPPWWSLMDAVYRQSRDQIRTRENGLWHALRIRTGEHLWRFVTARQDFLLAGILVVFLLLFGASLILLVPGVSLPGTAEIWENVEPLSAIVSLAGVVLSGVWLASRSLLSGSVLAAQTFVRSSPDPMERVGQRFRRLVCDINRPIVIFIDDLDRCQPAYVVSLLEGIQTLFNDPRVIYVVAADMRWLHCAFEQMYEPFTASVREPGRRLGSLFLDKAFELSISVPVLFPDSRQAYWRSLIRQSRGDVKQALEQAEEEARQEFPDSGTEDELVAKLSTTSPDPIREQARRQVVVERLASRRAEESTLLFLEPFAPLLESNPRSMKRLINTYAIQRDLAILAGLDVLHDIEKRKQLALWTILTMRWPLLAEYLIGKAGKMTDGPGDEVRHLFTRDDVKKVLQGDTAGVGIELDMEAIELFSGLRSQPASTPVAA